MTAVTANRSYYPALDGLRGMAILLVVLLHNFGFMNYFFFGWLGVDLFFVLSGFLITDILMNSLTNPFFLRNFYMRRVLRIFPLYYIVLIIFLVLLPTLKIQSLDISYYTSNQFWLWTYLQNWLYIFKEPYGDKILLHTWSLAVEEQFYLIWPITILLIRKPKKLLLIVIIVLVSAIITRYIVWNYKIENLAYSSLYTFTRIDGICIGCMLALLMKINSAFLKNHTSAIVLLMAIINFGFYFLNDRQSFTLPYLALVGYTTFAILFGILVYEAVIAESKIIKLIFTQQLLIFFGKISYGLYVYHWPIYLFLFPYFKRLLSADKNLSLLLPDLIAATFVTLIAIFISILSYRFIEKPFLKLKARIF